MKIEWKLLGAGDIELRPQFYKEKNGEESNKIGLLLYQNARTAMDAFDKQFGEFGWKCDYKQVADKIYGCIAVYDKDKQEWIEKWDTGEESNISADKGQASDILKRCAVKWGYGRELYTSPKIYVENDGYDCRGYKVSKIEYDENRRISFLEIVNKFGKVMWTTDTKATEQKKTEKKNNFQILQDFCTKQGLECPECQPAIKNFYAYWKKVLQEKDWKGTFSPETLWNNFKARMKKVA